MAVKVTKKSVVKKQNVAKPLTKASLRKEFLRADKLWQIWEIALTDLKLAEKTCDIDMRYWCIPPTTKGEACVVCAAGSIIHRRLDIKAFIKEGQEEITPTDFDEETMGKLEAINELREGLISDAYQSLHQNYHKNLLPQKWNMPNYGDGSKKFFERAKELLAYLEKEDI